jgi:Mrp family chromosome partitioning ATPase
MSSMDQSFVKSFSRRNRGESTSKSPAAADPQQATGGLSVDASVAASAAVWIDEEQSEVARADAGDDQPPQPHIDPPTRVAEAEFQAADRDAGRPVDVAIELAVTEVGPTVDPGFQGGSDVHTAYAGGSLAEELAGWVQTRIDRPEPRLPTEPAPVQPVPAQPPATAQPEPAQPPETTEPDAHSETAEDVHSEAAEAAPEAFQAGPADAETAAAVVPAQTTIVEPPQPLKPPQSRSAAATPVEVPINPPRADPPIGRGTPPTESKPDLDAPDHSAAESQSLAADPSPPFADTKSFRAAWEVDVFDVPGIVGQLFLEGKLFQQIAQRLQEAVYTGLRTVLVTSVDRGAGRSTVATGMAMAAAAAGIRVALVDADSNGPPLVDDLRLELEHGWLDSVRGQLPIKEVAVHAVEDGITLIPRLELQPGSAIATAEETAAMIEQIKPHFDLLVVDGPTGGASGLDRWAGVFDSAVIVCDPSRRQDLQISQLAERLRQSGVVGTGLVDNFVPR